MSNIKNTNTEQHGTSQWQSYSYTLAIAGSTIVDGPHVDEQTRTPRDTHTVQKELKNRQPRIITLHLAVVA